MPKTNTPSIILRASITLFIICFIFTGCTLIKLKKDVNKSLESTIIIGRVHGEFGGDGPIIVAARSTGREKAIVQHTVLHEAGEYELMVDQGMYLVFAYWDKNSNLVYDTGEPAGQFGDPTMVEAPAVGVVFDIDIEIPEEGRTIDIPHGTAISSDKPEKLYSRQAGDITSLDDERFSEENGRKGFWEPYTFFKRFGGNIYFLEKYDPEKIPILFIHGAGGSPLGWRYFVDNIDRKRFQPWFFYYPTGARIESMSYLLLWKLTNLHYKYKFNKIYFTAHSMGGLVARSFIVNYGEVFPIVKLFVSLATPWGGDRMAEYGVRQSPAVIPSWIDMQPNGDLIQSLYRKKMPEDVNFYMFYGYRGNRNPFRSNNDGTITFSSLLDNRPQTEAKMNFAFNEDHASIIYSKDVLAQYNTILSDFNESESVLHQRPGGYLKIHFAYDYDTDDLRHRPTLILYPIGDNGAESVTYLDSNDSGQILGPFPTGDYLASMVTMAGKPKENRIRVSVERNKTKELKFAFIPDGVIRGCVTTAVKPEDKTVGMPDYRYRSVDKEINIESITLEGNGIRRILHQIRGEEVNNYDYLITRDDFCYNTCFGFFELPAGDYKLCIRAEGFKTYEHNFYVNPGELNYFRVTELTPESGSP